MPLQINVSDSDLQHLNNQAKQELRSSVEIHIRDLLGEARRLETTHHTAGSQPEITSSHVSDAALLLRRGYRPPRKPRWVVAIQIVAAVSTLLAGALLDFDTLKDPLMLIVFIVVLCIAIGTTVSVLLKE